jgi:hypothetical protein
MANEEPKKQLQNPIGQCRCQRLSSLNSLPKAFCFSSGAILLFGQKSPTNYEYIRITNPELGIGNS